MTIYKNTNPLFTIGHSTLELNTFIKTLQSFGIEKLIDVRSYPASRYVPQFNKTNLMQELPAHNIEYMHLDILGGRRKSFSDHNLNLVEGWKNISFRCYASYTLTDTYEEGIQKLIDEASKKRICYMCAESVPWRCHRLLISNTLSARQYTVYHILSMDKCEKHQLNKYGAKGIIQDGRIIYPQ